MSTFVVTYSYLPQPDALARLRPERYTFFKELEARGALLASGQLLDDELGEGLLILRAANADEAASLLAGDPYVREGLVVKRLVSPWNPTLGAWIAP